MSNPKPISAYIGFSTQVYSKTNTIINIKRKYTTKMDLIIGETREFGFCEIGSAKLEDEENGDDVPSSTDDDESEDEY
jgi:hypothetical protein